MTMASAEPKEIAMRRRNWVFLAALAVLSGCSTVRLVESDVTSYTSWPESRTPGSFTFERLPSQQARPDIQARLEAVALPALQKAGLRPVDEGGKGDLTVQVGLAETRYYYNDPFYPYPFYGPGYFHGARYGYWGPGAAFGFSAYAPVPYYTYDAGVLIRDARTQQVVYETHAKYEGYWADDAIRAVLFEAAMKDFPRPALSPRRVAIEIPR
jgi:hypothetical protein